MRFTHINMRFNMHKSMVSISENPSLLERNVRNLMDLFMSKSNRFEDDNEDLVIDNQKCESAAAALSVGAFESMEQDHYNNWRKSVLDAKKKLLTAPIKRKNLLLFHEKKAKRKATIITMKMQHYKDYS